MRIDANEAFAFFKNQWHLQLKEGIRDSDVELLTLLKSLADDELMVPVEWKVCQLEAHDPELYCMEILICVREGGLRKLFAMENYFSVHYPPEEQFDLIQVERILQPCSSMGPKKWTGWLLRKQFEDDRHGPEDVRKHIARLIHARTTA